MTEAGPLGDVARVLGMVLLAALAAGAVLAPRVRTRAAAMLGAVALTPLLLVAEIWNTPQLESIRARPVLAVAAVGVGVVLGAALVLVFARRPPWFALAAVAAVPFRVPVEAGGETANLLVPLYVIIGAGALAWAIPRLRASDDDDVDDDGAAGAPRGALEWVLAGSVVLYALQAAYSSDVSKALEQVVFFYVPFAVLFVLLRELPWSLALARRCLLVLLALALVFVAIGFWEYATRRLLLNPKVIASNQFFDAFRVNSLFFDPNIYGRFLAMVMLLLSGVMLWTANRRVVWGAAAALAVLWAGLVLTLSQSSFAALLLGLGILALLRWRARWTLGALAVAAVIAGTVFVAAPRTFGLGGGRSLDQATSGRVALVEGGVDLVRAAPLLGHGSGSFATEYRRRLDAGNRRAVSASHTIPITIAAEQGIPGLALYVALLVCALLRLLRHARRAAARAVLAACFVALVLHTWTYAAFLEDPVTWTLLAVGTALAVALPARRARAAAVRAPAAAET